MGSTVTTNSAFSFCVGQPVGKMLSSCQGLNDGRARAVAYMQHRDGGISLTRDEESLSLRRDSRLILESNLADSCPN